MFKIPDGRKRFWQWDQGQRLSCDGLEAGVEVHFAHPNAVAGALVLETYQEDGTVYVDVPDELLRVGGKMTVYVYLEHGSEGHTAYRQSFTVQARQKPEDYVYTPSEVKRWDELDARVAALEQGGGGSVQANWSQNDESAADYVKDRTHYEVEEIEPNAVVLLEGITVDGTYYDDSQFYFSQEGTAEFEIGEIYRVSYCGVSMDVVANYTDTLFWFDENRVYWCVGVTGGSVHSLKFYGANSGVTKIPFTTDLTVNKVKHIVYPLDEKYIPDTILRTSALESAVDDALAQAKESGEFDGPAGKDGVIALTGAAVGQIARITAVDDDGVPTAWEPVDMPSGGQEVWETLAELSLEEDAVPFVDIGAVAASFRKIRFFLTLEAMNPTTVNLVLTNIENTVGGHTYIVFNGSIGNASGQYVLFVELEPLIEDGISGRRKLGANKTGTSSAINTADFIYNSYDTGRLKYCRYIYTSVALPAASTIKVTGVRA